MDAEKLFELIEKFDNSGLSEFKYRTTDDKIVLRKGSAPVQEAITAPSAQVQQQAPAVNTAAQPVDSAKGEIIMAPIVGTFYRCPSPDSPPFVEEGSTVKAGQTLCVIEAMKVLNELEADYDMEIVSILVENADMLEYATPLFEVKRL